MLRNVDELARGPKSKVWIDAGTLEGANTNCNAKALRDKLAARGFTSGEEVEFMRAEGARRSEQGWAHRVHHGPQWTFAARAEQKVDPARLFAPFALSAARPSSDETPPAM